MKNIIRKSATGIALYSMIASGVNAESNIYARKAPLMEGKMETVKQYGTHEFEKISFDSKANFEVPIPSTKTVVIDEVTGKEISENRYATREMKFKETIRYHELTITFFSYSYTFKEQSAVFLISDGEDEKKVVVGLKNEVLFDYIVPDHESAYRLHIKLDELKIDEHKVTVKLLRERIKPEEMNSSKK
ncbi:MAG: hypothetical protein QXE90_01680 [Candidatus Micrarchaeia archaeon]